MVQWQAQGPTIRSAVRLRREMGVLLMNRFFDLVLSVGMIVCTLIAVVCIVLAWVTR